MSTAPEAPVTPLRLSSATVLQKGVLTPGMNPTKAPASAAPPLYPSAAPDASKPAVRAPPVPAPPVAAPPAAAPTDVTPALSVPETSPTTEAAAAPAAAAAPLAGGAAASPATAAAAPRGLSTAELNLPFRAGTAPPRVHRPDRGRKRRGPRGHSKYRGVCITKTGKWRAVIYVERKQHYLGVFEAELDAAKAYDRAARRHFAGTAKLNFPDDPPLNANGEAATSGGTSAASSDMPRNLRAQPLILGGGGNAEFRARAVQEAQKNQLHATQAQMQAQQSSYARALQMQRQNAPQAFDPAVGSLGQPLDTARSMGLYDERMSPMFPGSLRASHANMPGPFDAYTTLDRAGADGATPFALSPEARGLGGPWQGMPPVPTSRGPGAGLVNPSTLHRYGAVPYRPHPGFEELQAMRQRLQNPDRLPYTLGPDGIHRPEGKAPQMAFASQGLDRAAMLDDLAWLPRVHLHPAGPMADDAAMRKRSRDAYEAYAMQDAMRVGHPGAMGLPMGYPAMAMMAHGPNVVPTSDGFMELEMLSSAAALLQRKRGVAAANAAAAIPPQAPLAHRGYRFTDPGMGQLGRGHGAGL